MSKIGLIAFTLYLTTSATAFAQNLPFASTQQYLERNLDFIQICPAENDWHAMNVTGGNCIGGASGSPEQYNGG